MIATASTAVPRARSSRCRCAHWHSLGHHLRCLRRRAGSSSASTSTCTRAEAKDKWFSTPAAHHQGTRPTAARWRAGVQLPGGVPGDPGLMQYGDVIVFLHEVRSPHAPRRSAARDRFRRRGRRSCVEGDFIRRPRRCWKSSSTTTASLTSFARHLPDRRGAAQGPVRSRMTTRGHLRLRERPSSSSCCSAADVTRTSTLRSRRTLDFDAAVPEATSRVTARAAYRAGDHFWARVHAPERLQLELLHLRARQGDRAGFLCAVRRAESARAVRPACATAQTVLAPRAPPSRAAQLVRDFLGRDTNLDAYRRWMLAEFDTHGYGLLHPFAEGARAAWRTAKFFNTSSAQVTHAALVDASRRLPSSMVS